MKATVLVVDDHPVTRAGILSILEDRPSVEIVGEAKDGVEAVDKAKQLKPDVAVMDISMPNLSGIDATKEILKILPEVKVIALTIHAGEKFVKEMLDAGAVGYLLKEDAPEELSKAIGKMMNGEMFLSSGVTRAALSKDENGQKAFNQKVLRTKLLRPPILYDYLERSRITNELDNNILKPLSITSAGAGYGKSVAISQWLEQAGRLHAWISLDEEHNELRIFLLYMVTAIEQVMPGSMNESSKAISGTELPAFDELVIIFLTDLCEIEGEMILVLDDYHKIHNVQVHKLLDEWLRFPPPAIHLSIITRRDPPLNLNSLRLTDRITEIRMSELSFAKEEIVKLFREVLNIDLGDKAIQSLYTKTEGWIIALRLASMIIKNAEDVEKVVDNIEGRMETISEYLISEVLSQLPEKVRNPLLVSSILNRFCDQLLDVIYLNGKELSGRDLIDFVDEANLFIIELDSENKWFRFHHLFQSLMQDLLHKRFSEEEIQNYHRIASKWFEDQSLLEEAMDHALVSGDYGRAIEIIKNNRLDLLNANNYYQLERLQRKIPMTIIESDADLLITELYIEWNHGNFPRLGELEALLNSMLDSIDKESPIHAESKFFIGFNSLFLRQDLGAAMKHFDKAMELIPESSAEPRGILETHYFIFGQLAGLYDKLHKMYYDLIRKDLVPQRRNRIYQGFFAASIDQASLLEVEKNAPDAIAFADSRNMIDSKSIVANLAGAAKLRKGKKVEAQKLLNGVLENRYHVHSRIVIDSLTGIIFIKLLNNDLTGADETLAMLESYIKNLDAFFNSFLWGVWARYHMFLGNHENIRELLKQYKPGVMDLVLWLDVPEITHARALIYEGSDESLEQAAKELEQLEGISSALQNRIHLYEILALKAILLQQKGDIQGAEETLSRSLEIAEPEKMYIYYAELGNLFVSLVEDMPDKIKTRPIIMKALDQIKEYHLPKVKKSTGKAKEKIIALTQRELVVLHCIAECLRNQEIAEKLFNSEETIKKHIYNMFQKMEVKNRLSLVTRAKEEGILEQ